MLGPWQRHPRYAIVVVFIVLTTTYLLRPYLIEAPPASTLVLIRDNGLPGRLTRAESAYEKMLERRQKMIEKHGPTPFDVAM